jgi:hypothetical protein
VRRDDTRRARSAGAPQGARGKAQKPVKPSSRAGKDKPRDGARPPKRTR